MRLAILTFFLFFLGLSPAMAGGVDEQRSGKGWITLHPLPTSPDYAFLRNFIESDEVIGEAVVTFGGHIDDMEVAYWDLNDDGLEEMFLRFTKTAVPVFCSNDDCFSFLFVQHGGQWHFVQQLMLSRLFVGDEKVEGYRSLYSETGGYRWTGTDYADVCPVEPLPPEVSQYYPSLWCPAQ